LLFVLWSEKEIAIGEPEQSFKLKVLECPYPYPRSVSHSASKRSIPMAQSQESIQAVNGARPTVMPSKHFHSGVPSAWASF